MIHLNTRPTSPEKMDCAFLLLTRHKELVEGSIHSRKNRMPPLFRTSRKLLMRHLGLHKLS